MRTVASLTMVSLMSAGSAYVIPIGFDNTPGNGSFALTATAAAGRTYQYQIHQDQLVGLVGYYLTGLQWRLNETITVDWPSVDTSYSFFNVFIGPGVDPATRSSTFANNFSGTPTQVRSGGLVFPAGSFSSVGSPVKPFGPVVSFNLANYEYQGGHLTIEMRFSAQSGATNQPIFDGCTSSTVGYGSQFAASWQSDANATTALTTTANFLVTNITAVPVPEPATLGMLGVGLLALLKRRRK